METAGFSVSAFLFQTGFPKDWIIEDSSCQLSSFCISFTQFIKQTSIEHLLHARHCSRFWIVGEERWRKNPLYIPGEEIQTLNKSKEGYLILYEKEIRAMEGKHQAEKGIGCSGGRGDVAIFKKNFILLKYAQSLSHV